MTKRTWLGGISVGDGQDVAVAGALNVSPESFYDGSVVIQADHLLRAAEAMTRAGAAFVDVGAMSTAPYLAARIPESQEADRLAWAIDLLVKKLDLPISADTSRSLPARAALAAGARIINDVTGLTGDPQMARLAGRAGVGLILMASEASNREDRAAGRRGAGAPASERGGQGSASRRTARGWGPGVRGEQSGRSSRRTARGWGPGVRGEQSGRSNREDRAAGRRGAGAPASEASKSQGAVTPSKSSALCSRRVSGSPERPASTRRSSSWILASGSSETRTWHGTSGTARCSPGSTRFASWDGRSASACRASPSSGRWPVRRTRRGGCPARSRRLRLRCWAGHISSGPTMSRRRYRQ